MEASFCFQSLGDSIQGLHEVKGLTDQAASERQGRSGVGVSGRDFLCYTLGVFSLI